MKKFLVAGFVFASVFSFAQTSKEKKVMELLEVMGTKKTMEGSLSTYIDFYKKSYPNIPSEFWNAIMNKKNVDDLLSRLIPIYSKNFEENEIDDLLKFYRTETGKKIIQKLPSIMKESMEAGQIWGRNLGEQIQKELGEKYEESLPASE